MTHEQEHPNPNPHDDPTPRPLIWISAVGTVGLVAIIIGLVALYNQVQTRYTKEIVYQSPNENVRLLHNQQEAKLHSIAWVDREKGIVTIPIDQAMKLVARELRSETEPAATGPTTREAGHGN